MGGGGVRRGYATNLVGHLATRIESPPPACTHPMPPGLSPPHLHAPTLCHPWRAPLTCMHPPLCGMQERAQLLSFVLVGGGPTGESWLMTNKSDG